MEVSSGAASYPRSPKSKERFTRARGLRAVALLCLALLLPAGQIVHAVDIYYARAIGDEYLPERTAPAPSAPNSATERPLPELPGLGARAEATAPPKQEMSLWSKVLIGAVLVTAIAALGNNGGGGGAGVTVGTGDTSGTPTGDGSSGGGSGGGQGGAIDIGIGLGQGAGNNRDNGDDDDD